MPRQLMTVAQIMHILHESPDRLKALTDGMTEAGLHASPEPGEWSVTEILAHLRSCADMWGGAIETILATDHPTIRAVNPVTWIKSTDYRELEFASSLRAFAMQRDHLLSILGPLSAQGWTRSATVVGGGNPIERSVHSYADRLARHERTHWRQVAKTAQRSSTEI